MALTTTETTLLIKRGFVLAVLLIVAALLVESTLSLLVNLVAPFSPTFVTSSLVDLSRYAKQGISIVGVVLAAYIGADAATTN